MRPEKKLSRRAVGVSGDSSDTECPIHRQQQRRPAGLLLSALRTGDIDR